MVIGITCLIQLFFITNISSFSFWGHGFNKWCHDVNDVIVRSPIMKTAYAAWPSTTSTALPATETHDVIGQPDSPTIVNHCQYWQTTQIFRWKMLVPVINRPIIARLMLPNVVTTKQNQSGTTCIYFISHKICTQFGFALFWLYYYLGPLTR